MKKHSNKALAIVIIFSLFVSTFPNISGTSYSDIQIDGNLSEWDNSDFLGQRTMMGISDWHRLTLWPQKQAFLFWKQVAMPLMLP